MPKRERQYGAPCRAIAFGSDHAGFGLKRQIMEHVKAAYPGITIRDFGTDSESNRVDYPDIAGAVCGAIQSGAFDRGVLLDGAGVASGIAANKFAGIRAAVVHDHFSVSMGRKHNDCNVIALGGKTLGIEAAKEIVDVFIKCEFEGDRHIPRLKKLERIEEASADAACEVAVQRSSVGGVTLLASPFKLPQ
jgi:ribose 5-phosphate isomerase B